MPECYKQPQAKMKKKYSADKNALLVKTELTVIRKPYKIHHLVIMVCVEQVGGGSDTCVDRRLVLELRNLYNNI